jgi:Fe-S-cluster containining protein
MAICITYSDIIRWHEQGRKDILSKVSFAEGFPAGDGFYIADTVLKPKRPCPFLVDSLCSIHPIKPVSCKDAPAGFTKFDLCPVWKPEHINRKRLKKVQRRQVKDFKKSATNFPQLYRIILEARSGN